MVLHVPPASNCCVGSTAPIPSLTMDTQLRRLPDTTNNAAGDFLIRLFFWTCGKSSTMCAHEWNCQGTACITLVRLHRDRFVSRRAAPIRPPTSHVRGVPDTLEEELSKADICPHLSLA